MNEAASWRTAGVTAREEDVLRLLAEQLTYAEIGERLFISARTVESHVTSLRRKLGAGDRRELWRLALEVRAAGRDHAGRLPVALTSFVGRRHESDELTEALAARRLVSLVGTGGVGKTRLAVAVAARLSERYADGVRFTDLLPVSDPDDVAGAVLASIGGADRSGLSPTEALTQTLAGRHVLLLLDNCEQVVDAVARLAERVLSSCPRVTVLVTSRTRLVVPHEHVVALGGLDSTVGESDAVELFLERSGQIEADEDQRRRVAAICESLGGLALAVELAAARRPALGLDGLEAALQDQVELLTGGARVNARHRSLVDLLDWSCRFVQPRDNDVLDACSVFLGSFDVASASAVADLGSPGEVATSLATLAEHSLLETVGTALGLRYRELEPVRQFASRRVLSGRELQARYVAWASHEVAGLVASERDDAWQAAVDAVAGDLRAALLRAGSGRPDAPSSADDLARLLFRRGRAREAQGVWEWLAATSGTPAAAAAALERAAAVAACRVLGDECRRLQLAAVLAHRGSGDLVAAASALARVAEHSLRFAGMYVDEPSAEDAAALLDEATRLAGNDPSVAAAVAVAEAHAETDPGAQVQRARAAAVQADEVADPVLAGSAYDALLLGLVMTGDLAGAVGASRRRVERAPEPTDPSRALEVKDALHTGVLVETGAGHLHEALVLGRRHLLLGFISVEPDLAAEDLLLPAALAGEHDEVLALAPAYLAAWRDSGSPVAPGRASGPAAVAHVHGLLGQEDDRRRWLDVAAVMRGGADDVAQTSYGRVLAAVLDLEQERPADARARLASAPEAGFLDRAFAPWRAALLAEAAVLSGAVDADLYVERAVRATAEFGVPDVLARRAAMLLDGRSPAGLAAELATAGCPYQAERTRILAARASR